MPSGTIKHEPIAQTIAPQSPSRRLSRHLIGLPGSQWAFWRSVGLRGAGFPAREVLRLAASRPLLEAVDALLRAEERAEGARARALEIVNESLNQLRARGDWANKEKRVPLVTALQKLKSGEVPKPLPEAEEGEAIEALRRAAGAIPAPQEAFAKAFADFTVENSRVLHEIAGRPDFREAVTWQNRQAVHTALDTLLRTPIDGRPLTSKSRQDEEMVASYVQRYCAKNDTIGFFGPVGWATFVPEGETLTIQLGPGLLATRKVYFETWPIEALGQAMIRELGVHPWLVPIRMPFVRLEGSVLHHPVYGALRMSAGQVAILRAADGYATAKSIAQELCRTGGLIESEGQFYQTLADLASKGMVFWDFNIPYAAHPELALREWVEGIEDESRRRQALAMLDELELAREGITRAAGSAEKLDQAFTNLERTFTRLTGASSTRNQGQTYAGRTIVYEDCRRDVKVNLGPELLKAIAEPLSLLLTSARWLTWKFASLYRSRFKEYYKELSRSAGQHAVDAAAFFQRASPLFFLDKGELGRPVQQEFQEKWERILRIGPADKPLHYSSQSLTEAVSREFQAPRSGWKAARYHSPDIMIAASSAEAIQRGDYMLAMGELHVSGNTLGAALFMNQHPSPEDLIRAVEDDLDGPNAVPVPSRDVTEQLARTSASLISPGDFRLEYGRGGLAHNRTLALPISSLVLEEKKGELVARTRDRSQSFDFMELIGLMFQSMIIDSFRMIGAMRHAPRVSIDRLIIKRESWRFEPAQLSFARLKQPAERFLATQRWARKHELPHLVFFKVPVERKPVYLDLHSPTLVDIFCKMVRRTLDENPADATVDITEMLPTTEQTWLTDAAGQRYTCELRVVAVDLAR